MSKGLQAGCAQVPITPPMGVELAGYGPYRERIAHGVAEDLQATALVLRDGDQQVALVALDLLTIPAQLAARTRETVAYRTTLAPSQVLLACTHTHSGPATLFARGWGAMAPVYDALLPRHIARAVELAEARLEPASLLRGRTRVRGVAVNRAASNGPVHDELDVVAVEGGHDLLALVLGFACHPVVHPPEYDRVSRDYVGTLASALAQTHPSAGLLYLQGAAGDIDPALRHTGATAEVARELASGVDRALAGAEVVGAPLLAARLAPCHLPLLPTPREVVHEVRAAAERALAQHDTSPEQRAQARFDLDWSFAELARLDSDTPTVRVTEVQALRLSAEVALVASGGEVFTVFGQRIRHLSDFAQTLVVGYANDGIGHVPDRAEFDRRGYAAVVVPRIYDYYPYRPDVGDLLCEASLTALEQLREPVGAASG